MEKINILPQTIFRFKCDRYLVYDTLAKIKNEEWIITEGSIKFTTKNIRLEKKPQYKNLYKWFHECLNKVKTELKFDCDEFKITQSWGNKEEFNQWHHSHIHPNSIVSGIFYLTNSNANTWFSMKNIWTNYNMNLYEIFKLNVFDKSQIIHKQKTISGDLIIFPSSLVHSVDEHQIQNNPRYTMSFNSFPCGKIGNHELLTGLEIDIK
jgi:uncharacterized protein (TIGR02466 family)